MKLTHQEEISNIILGHVTDHLQEAERLINIFRKWGISTTQAVEIQNPDNPGLQVLLATGKFAMATNSAGETWIRLSGLTESINIRENKKVLLKRLAAAKDAIFRIDTKEDPRKTDNPNQHIRDVIQIKKTLRHVDLFLRKL